MIKSVVEISERHALKSAIFFVALLSFLSYHLLVQAQDSKTFVRASESELNAGQSESDVTISDFNHVEEIETPAYEEEGVASWYGKGFHLSKTANGEKYDMRAFTAAHKNLPFGTIVKVTNLSNGKSVLVRINDRGPHVKGRVIDLSNAAAQEIGLSLDRVRLEVFMPVEDLSRLAPVTNSGEEASNMVISFSREHQPVHIQSEFSSLFSSENFTQTVKEWKRLGAKDKSLFLSVMKNADDSEGDISYSYHITRLQIPHNADVAVR